MPFLTKVTKAFLAVKSEKRYLQYLWMLKSKKNMKNNELSYGDDHGLIKYIDSKAKCRRLKKLPVKWLCGRRLSVGGPLPSPDPIPPWPLHTVYVYIVYLFTQERGAGGGGGVKAERWLEGQQFTKLGRKYKHYFLNLQSINSDKHLLQSPYTGQFL